MATMRYVDSGRPKIKRGVGDAGPDRFLDQYFAYRPSRSVERWWRMSVLGCVLANDCFRDVATALGSARVARMDI